MGSTSQDTDTLAPPSADQGSLWLRSTFEGLLRTRPWVQDWVIPVTLPSGFFNDDKTTGPLPFLSIRAFKFGLLTAAPDAALVRRFFSSGSTGMADSSMHKSRGCHAMTAHGVDAYRRAAHQGYQDFLKRYGLSPYVPLICLVPRPTDWPDSSLAAMLEGLSTDGFPIIWSSPENVAEAFDEAWILCAKGQQTHQTAAVVFGTSLHHHQVAAWSRRALPSRESHRASSAGLHPWQRIVAVDTGGAKGKTMVLDAATMKDIMVRSYIQHSSAPECVVESASEYGMCELASQAWSTPGEPRSFVASPTLSVVALDPQTWSALPPGEPGFLAFIDRANVDSYPALVTEDVGYATSPQTFFLMGRAPMASIKGCSLRVGALPPFPMDSTFDPPRPSLQRQQQSLRAVASADSASWAPLPAARPPWFTKREWHALHNAWESWRMGRHQQVVLQQKKQWLNPEPHDLLVVASANASIALLFPLCAAWENSFSSATISLPGMRDDDPLAPVIKEQILWLVDFLNDAQPSIGAQCLCVRVLESSPEAEDLRTCSLMLVFGTNETIEIFRLAMNQAGSRARLVGMGDHINGLYVGLDSSPAAIAEACLAWRGRGCLTPRIVVIKGSRNRDADDERLNDPSVVTVFVRQCADVLGQMFTEEFCELPSETVRMFHAHSLIEIRARTSGKAKILGGAGWAVIDLCGIPIQDFTNRNTLQADLIELNLAGQGLVYFMDEACYDAWTAQRGIAGHDTSVNFVSVYPGYADLHMGQRWSKWVSWNPDNF